MTKKSAEKYQEDHPQDTLYEIHGAEPSFR